jgi:predicted transcriptional regulator
MLRKVVSVYDDAPVIEGLKLLMAKKSKRLSVINGEQTVVGLLERNAVPRTIAGELYSYQRKR